MKLINIFILLFLISCSSSSQHTCEIDDVLDAFLNTDVSYSIDQESVDLTNVFKNHQTPYLGFIGENKKKIDFLITSIKRDTNNLNVYLIKGNTQIYSEKLRYFKGKISLENQYKFSERLDDDVFYSDSILKQGFSILTYEFKENVDLNNAGVFKGNLIVSWYIDTSNNTNYDDTLDYIPSYTNCCFFGNWINNNRDEKHITGWSHYRIPCSDDLDIGAAEFSPNPKYYNQGWESYGNELIEHSNKVFAKIIDEDGYVNMRKQKNATSEIIIQIQTNEIVEILSIEENWWLISYNGISGYIHKSRLKLVK